MKKALQNAAGDAADDAAHNATNNDVMAQHTPSKASARPMHYISRQEEPEAGWQVDIRARKKRWQNLFADQAHGGTEQALANAQAWRDAVRLEMRRARGKTATSEQRLTSRNTSGLVGVSRSVTTFQTRSGTTQVVHWVAQWSVLSTCPPSQDPSPQQHNFFEMPLLGHRPTPQSVSFGTLRTLGIAQIFSKIPLSDTPPPPHADSGPSPHRPAGCTRSTGIG